MIIIMIVMIDIGDNNSYSHTQNNHNNEYVLHNNPHCNKPHITILVLLLIFFNLIRCVKITIFVTKPAFNKKKTHLV